jgi:LPS O-antigen subunit length determinant protein (WzzB/FepE family)
MEQEIVTEPRKKHTKSKIIIFSITLILIGIAYGYFWYQSTNTLRQEADSVLEDVEKFNVLSEALNKEKGHCQIFITQQEGDFGSFEYCKKFIEWININNLIID